MKKIALYNYSLSGGGGVVTFVKNFCKRMSKHYDITVYFVNANNETLFEIAEHANIKRYNGLITCDTVILSSAWGKEPTIKANKVIQVIHSDFKEQKKQFGFVYKKHPLTTMHVAVGQHVKEVFEKMYPYKVDKVINNLLDV